MSETVKPPSLADENPLEARLNLLETHRIRLIFASLQYARPLGVFFVRRSAMAFVRPPRSPSLDSMHRSSLRPGLMVFTR